MKTHCITHIQWRDSHSKDGWMDSKDAKRFAKVAECRIMSCGLLHSESKRFITISIGFAESGQVGHMLKIPKSAVLERHDFKSPKRGKKK